MTKTTNSVSPRRTVSTVTVTAAQVTALSGLTTAEDIDISSVVVDVALGKAPERQVDKQPVHGDAYPILTHGEDISEAVVNITLLYTKGLDQLGTDNIDIYSDFFWPIFNYTTSPLPIQFKWSPTGTVGDEEFVCDSDETFINSCPPPVGGTTTEKIKTTISLETAQITKVTIT